MHKESTLEHKKRLNREANYRYRERNRARYLELKRFCNNSPEGKTKRHAYYEQTKHKQWLESKKRYLRYREQMFVILGSSCKHCGITDRRVLQVDHVNGGGQRDRGIGIRKQLSKIQDIPSLFQILCANCNWIKRCERGETGTYQDKLSARLNKHR